MAGGWAGGKVNQAQDLRATSGCADKAHTLGQQEPCWLEEPVVWQEKVTQCFNTFLCQMSNMKNRWVTWLKAWTTELQWPLAPSLYHVLEDPGQVT